jgi:hypothetical protein
LFLHENEQPEKINLVQEALYWFCKMDDSYPLLRDWSASYGPLMERYSLSSDIFCVGMLHRDHVPLLVYSQPTDIGHDLVIRPLSSWDEKEQVIHSTPHAIRSIDWEQGKDRLWWMEGCTVHLATLSSADGQYCLARPAQPLPLLSEPHSPSFVKLWWDDMAQRMSVAIQVDQQLRIWQWKWERSRSGTWEHVCSPSSDSDNMDWEHHTDQVGHKGTVSQWIGSDRPGSYLVRMEPTGEQLMECDQEDRSYVVRVESMASVRSSEGEDYRMVWTSSRGLRLVCRNDRLQCSSLDGDHHWSVSCDLGHPTAMAVLFWDIGRNQLWIQADRQVMCLSLRMWHSAMKWASTLEAIAQSVTEPLPESVMQACFRSAPMVRLQYGPSEEHVWEIPRRLLEHRFDYFRDPLTSNHFQFSTIDDFLYPKQSIRVVLHWTRTGQLQLWLPSDEERNGNEDLQDVAVHVLLGAMRLMQAWRPYHQELEAVLWMEWLRWSTPHAIVSPSQIEFWASWLCESLPSLSQSSLHHMVQSLLAHREWRFRCLAHDKAIITNLMYIGPQW